MCLPQSRRANGETTNVMFTYLAMRNTANLQLVNLDDIRPLSSAIPSQAPVLSWEDTHQRGNNDNGRIDEMQDHALHANQEQGRSGDNNTVYLDLLLMQKLNRRWRAARQKLHHLGSGLLRLTFGRKTSDVRDRFRIESYQTDEVLQDIRHVRDDPISSRFANTSRAILVKTLKISRLFNAACMLCYGLLLANTILTIAQTFQLVNLTQVGQRNYSGATSSNRYFPVVTTLLDFMNNLHWLHSKRSITARKEYSTNKYNSWLDNVKWLLSGARSLSSGRHLFQAAFVSLHLASGYSEASPLGLTLDMLNYLTQIVHHGYNYDRIRSYQKVIADGEEVCLKQDSDCSRWPIDLSKFESEARASYRFKFQWCQMISQMLVVKLTIFTLLLHVDSVKHIKNLEGATLFSCLVGAFLAMHSYYDKYYSRYSRPATC